MIYTVNYADTLYSVCRHFDVDEETIIKINRLLPPYSLCPGSSLLILIPRRKYIPEENDTLDLISKKLNMNERELRIKNPDIEELIRKRKNIVLSYRGESDRQKLQIGGYVYPYIKKNALSELLPFLSSITPFSYKIDRDGKLGIESDCEICRLTESSDVRRIMHVSNISEKGKYNPQIAEALMTDSSVCGRFIDNVIECVTTKSYGGVDINIEYIQPSHREKYAKLLFMLKESLRTNAPGRSLTVSLPPKFDLSPCDPRSDGIDYRLISEIPDKLHIMAYGWGRRFGIPQAIAPNALVRKTLEYTLKFVCPDKIILGIPNYGLDWSYPSGDGAKVISCNEALSLAAAHKATVYHLDNSSSCFTYSDKSDISHTVFFEDLNSLSDKLRIVRDYKIDSIAIWNLMHVSTPMLMMIANSL